MVVSSYKKGGLSGSSFGLNQINPTSQPLKVKVKEDFCNLLAVRWLLTSQT